MKYTVNRQFVLDIQNENIETLNGKYYGQYSYKTHYPNNTDTVSPIIDAPRFRIPRFEKEDEKHIDKWLKAVAINIYGATVASDGEISPEGLILGIFVRYYKVSEDRNITYDLFDRKTNAVNHIVTLYKALESLNGDLNKLDELNDEYYKIVGKKRVRYTYNSHPTFLKNNNLNSCWSSQDLRSKCENILFKRCIIDFMDSCDTNTLNTLESVVEALKTYENSELSQRLGKKSRDKVFPFKNIDVKKLSSVLNDTKYCYIKTEKEKDKQLVKAYYEKYPTLSARKIFSKLKDDIKLSQNTVIGLISDFKKQKELKTYSKQKSAYIVVDDVDQTNMVKEEEITYIKTQKRKIGQHSKLYSTI